MPPVSQAQRRWAYWKLKHAKSKKATDLAREFLGHGVTGLPERVEKALQISEVEHVPNELVTLDFHRHDDPKVAARITLWHADHHKPGEWYADNIVPARWGSDPGAVSSYRQNQNQFGPAHIRELYRHLHDHYGVRRMVGTRITGAREKFDKPDKHSALTLGKGLRLGRTTWSHPEASTTWHQEGTTENPFNPYKRVVQRGDTAGTYEVRPDSSLWNHWHVNEVQAVTRGGGRLAMEHLTRLADRHGVSLQLFAEPLKPMGEGVKMKSGALKQWYRGFGFRPVRGDLMTRVPTRMEKAMPASPFSDLLARLQKGEYFKRIVQFIGGTNPKPHHLVQDTNINSTLRTDGRVARIKVGAVKMSAVPEQKKGKLRRQVTNFIPDAGKKYKDTDTEKYTFHPDGSASKIQFFAKSFRALYDSISRLS